MKTWTYLDTWLALYKIGAPDVAIAEICDCPVTRIRRWRKKWSLPAQDYNPGKKTPPWTSVHQCEIQDVLDKIPKSGR